MRRRTATLSTLVATGALSALGFGLAPAAIAAPTLPLDEARSSAASAETGAGSVNPGTDSDQRHDDQRHSDQRDSDQREHERGDRPQGHRGHHAAHHIGHRLAHLFGHHPARHMAVDVLTDTLGLSSDELRQARADGTTLAELAGQNDVPVDMLVDALVDAASTRITEAVADDKMSQERADEILAHLEERITNRVNGLRPDGSER